MDTITAPKNYKFSTKEFRYSFHPDGGTYIHRFPVWKYNRNTVLECELTIDESTGEVQFNVFDINRVPYAPFYYVYCGNHDLVLDKVLDTINLELKRLGLIKNDTATV